LVDGRLASAAALLTAVGVPSAEVATLVEAVEDRCAVVTSPVTALAAPGVNKANDDSATVMAVAARVAGEMFMTFLSEE
jgi:hypothetical protein